MVTPASETEASSRERPKCTAMPFSCRIQPAPAVFLTYAGMQFYQERQKSRQKPVLKTLFVKTVIPRAKLDGRKVTVLPKTVLNKPV